jgi:hypothetical protein
MSRCGIPGYQPQWLGGRRDVVAAHGGRLAALAGQVLRHVWVVWDLEDDAWFADAPVVLEFDGVRLAVDHQKSDEIALGWDVPDPAVAIDGGGLRLAWRAEPFPELAALTGRTLRRAVLLEWHNRGRVMTLAAGFDLAPDWLTVQNAGDENGFAYARPNVSWKSYPAGGSPIVRVTEFADLTEEVRTVVDSVHAFLYQHGKVDWPDFLYRVDGAELPDGSVIDLGPDPDSAAIRGIKAQVSALRRWGW